MRPRGGGPCRAGPGLGRPALALVAIVAASACASTPHLPAGFSPGDPVVIVYRQSPSRGHPLDLALINRSHTAAAGLTSLERGSPSVKVIPDEDMDALLAGLDATGFFRHAEPLPPGARDVPEGALWTLSLERPAGTLAVAFRREGGGVSGARERMEDLAECKQVFHFVYSTAISFQAVDNPEGAELFRRFEERGAKVVEGGQKP